MGNSTGNLAEWWHAMRASTHGQGLFLWDWVDQGLRMPSGCGFGHGGDFGDRMHDAQFCINGLVFADRSAVHPGLLEVWHLARPLTVALHSWEMFGRSSVQLELRVSSTRVFESIAGVDLQIELTIDGHTVVISRPPCVNQLTGLRAGESTILGMELVLGSRPPQGLVNSLIHPSEAYLLVEMAQVGTAASGGQLSWAPNGHVVSREQIRVPEDGLSRWLAEVEHSPPPRSVRRRPTAPTTAHHLRVIETDKSLVVENGVGASSGGMASFSVTFDRQSGSIRTVQLNGRAIVTHGPSLSLWRAPTDNDEGDATKTITHPQDDKVAEMTAGLRLPLRLLRMLRRRGWLRALDLWLLGQEGPIAVHSWAQHWRADGLDALVATARELTVLSATESRVVIRSVVDLHAPGGERRATHVTTVTVHAEDEEVPFLVLAHEVHVECRVARTCLPRVGLALQLPPEMARVRYYGLGPHENYPDRKAAAILAVHEARVEDMHTPYVVPSENGLRCGARWVQLQSATALPAGGHHGLQVCGNLPLCFSASRYSAAQLSAATHQDELSPSDSVHLHVDIAHQGVGGDVGWSRSVRPEYLVPQGTHRFALVLRPFAAGGSSSSATPCTPLGRDVDATLQESGFAALPSYEPPRPRSAGGSWALLAGAVLVAGAGVYLRTTLLVDVNER